MAEHEHKKHAGHGIHETRIKHHHDGTHTISHHDEHGNMHPHSESAKGDLDQVHDHLENTIGTPNAGEAEANAGQSGIPGEAAAPAPAAPVAAPAAVPAGPGM